MPYDFAQFLLTVLFDCVLLCGIVFVLMACGLEASRRKFQQQFQSHALSTISITPLSLPPATEPVNIPLRSAQYDSEQYDSVQYDYRMSVISA